MKTKHPYKELLNFQYWNKTIENSHFIDLKDIWNAPILFDSNMKIATAGSCFAQHVTKHIKMRKLNFMDMEPPTSDISSDLAEQLGYNIYSCRYGNIYTIRQLLQLLQESLGFLTIKDIVWSKQESTNIRYFDSMRPNITPNGYENPIDVINERAKHLINVRKMFERVDVFIFTMGLTETWKNIEENIVYPSAPGVIAGEYDKNKYQFHNFNYTEILQDLETFYDMIIKINPNFKMILTVSPVPLKATYTGQHVIVANNYSKSTLRAVASDFSMKHRGVYYFPSYELINSHCNRGMFYEPNLREVNNFGVNYVMQHFFNDENKNRQVNDDLICDEDFID